MFLYFQILARTLLLFYSTQFFFGKSCNKKGHTDLIRQVVTKYSFEINLI